MYLGYPDTGSQFYMGVYLSTSPIQLALEHRKKMYVKSIASNLEQVSLLKSSIDDLQSRRWMREVLRDNFTSLPFFKLIFTGKIIV